MNIYVKKLLYNFQKKIITNKLISNVLTIFGMDLRSIALFRVFVGLTVIFDVLNRWSDIKAHYSGILISIYFIYLFLDEGLLPRFIVLEYFYNDSWLTLHMIGGTSINYL